MGYDPTTKVKKDLVRLRLGRDLLKDAHLHGACAVCALLFALFWRTTSRVLHVAPGAPF